MICKNSTGKVFGKVFIEDNRLIIKHNTKPELIIDEPEIVHRVLNKDTSVMLELFDDYLLCIGEIASLFDMKYHQANAIIRTLPTTTNNNTGRRNSSFNAVFSESRLKAMCESHKGQTPVGYERTPEIKKKISDTLKRRYASGELHNDPKKFSDAWVRGCYDEVSMGRGIQGYMYSKKMHRDIYFRSLLELNYFILIESDNRVQDYKVESFQIRLSEKSHYTPDVLINNRWLVEIKPDGHLSYTDCKRFEDEVDAATKYCDENGLKFFVVYDKDIEFSTRKYKRYLRDNPNIIEQFNIRFNDESVIHKNL